jgi:hypothetical protein
LTLPDGLIYIDTWAFAYTILQTLDLPDTVTEMQSYACAFMDRLESIKMPSQLTYIGSAAFAGCAQLTDVTLNDGLLEIGQGAFAGAGMKSIVVPSSVDTIGYCAFGYEKDMETSNSNFVIYGVSGSAAQTYATDTDSEYDYTNNFTFISKTDDQIAEMLSGESDAEEDAADDPVEVVVEEEENQNFGMIMKIALLVLGGIVLCGGVAAIVLSSKKKKD